jgi:uncharacterized protein YrrD
MRTTKDLQGVKVLGGAKGTRKIGKIRYAVFHPDEARLVGYVVRRPDFLLMFRRSDRFLAFDSFRIVDGRLVAYKDADAWDEAACKRLGFSFDECFVWEGMPLRTESGQELGRIDQITYDEQTGQAISFTVVQGASWLVGKGQMPVSYLLRFTEGSFVLSDEAAAMELEGGLAAKAGERVAQTAAGLASTGKVVGEAAEVGVKKASGALFSFKEKYIDLTDEEEAALVEHQAQRYADEVPSDVSVEASSIPTPAPPANVVEQATGAVVNQVKKSKGMFSSFKEEYEKAKNGE